MHKKEAINLKRRKGRVWRKKRKGKEEIIPEIKIKMRNQIITVPT